LIAAVRLELSAEDLAALTTAGAEHTNA